MLAFKQLVLTQNMSGVTPADMGNAIIREVVRRTTEVFGQTDDEPSS